MNLESMVSELRPAVEKDLQRIVEKFIPADDELKSMVSYHFGWEGEGAGQSAQGKRIRPQLILLPLMVSQMNWEKALPAASAVEIVHNFSLIHDDIQDQSVLRRGRPTLWTRWGIAQAINTGDFLYTLAYSSLLELQGSYSSSVCLEAVDLLSSACVQLTRGQYLDLANENEKSIPMDDYWIMVGGKTAALLGFCTAMGALLCGFSGSKRNAAYSFGYQLGLAFQVVDDWLGIWGDAAQTGKSNASDLLSGKKSLPVLYGLEVDGPFSQRWNQGSLSADEIPQMVAYLDEAGVEQRIHKVADQKTQEAMSALQEFIPDPIQSAPLVELANQLLGRSQ
jgi:geranylgeranyl diphosphate synthase, type I